MLQKNAFFSQHIEVPELTSSSFLPCGEYFPKFDRDYWAGNESRKTGEKVADILKRWEDLGSKARNEGTNLHNQIENFYNEIEYKNSPEFEKFMKFHERYIVNKYEPFRTEWRVFDDSKLLAGTIDMVYKKSDNEVFLFDWKRLQGNFKYATKKWCKYETKKH